MRTVTAPTTHGDRRREWAVLLACARGRFDDSAGARARQSAAAGLDWEYLLALANAHRVSELVLNNLETAGVPVPGAVEARLNQRARDTALNLSLTHQVADLLDALESSGIRALAFKGPVLAALAYGHVGLRSFVDLDILVPRSAIREVRRVMIASGYEHDPAEHRLFDGPYPRAARDEVFRPTKAGPAKVEVHVAIPPWDLGVALDTSALLSRAVSTNVAGRSIRTLQSEDLMLALAVHGTVNVWCVVKFVSEIDAVSRLDLDWEVVIERGRQARVQRMLCTALLLAERLLETPLPPSVRALAQRDREAVVQAGDFAQRLFGPPPSLVGVRLGVPWRIMKTHERAVDRAGYLVRHMIYEKVLMEWDKVTRARR